jgi:hypothetical protein
MCSLLERRGEERLGKEAGERIKPRGSRAMQVLAAAEFKLENQE